MDKVRLIEGSLRCFQRSLAGLLPVLGLPFAVHAVFAGRRLRRQAGSQWNPAGNYLAWGAVLGWLGILLTASTCAAVCLVGIHQYYPGGTIDTFSGIGGD